MNWRTPATGNMNGISWTLSIVPAVVRDTLAPAAKQDAATRKKIIDLALQLAPSTVAR